MPEKRKPLTRDPEKAALRAENANLRKKLAETEKHRNLLIETLHGLSRKTATFQTLAVSAAGTAEVAAMARPQTLAKLRKVLSSYGIVPNPTNSTIVGPAVPSMGQFTLDVNNTFARNYVNSILQSSWDVNQ